MNNAEQVAYEAGQRDAWSLAKERDVNLTKRIAQLEKHIESLSGPTPSWEDRKDEWSESIADAFPTRSGSHDEWGVAMQMVGNRRSKTELIALVNWLLLRMRDGGLRLLDK